MRRLVVTLDDSLDLWLSVQKNQARVIREALNVYRSDITTDTLSGIRASYKVLHAKVTDMDSKLDYIAALLQKGGK